MRVTALEKNADGYWVMAVERDVVLRSGFLGLRTEAVTQSNTFASEHGVQWRDATTGDRAPFELEVILEELFGKQEYLQSISGGLAP